MDENTKIIRDYYDAQVQGEWGRIANRTEFLSYSEHLMYVGRKLIG